MPQISKNIVDADLRNRVFDDCINEGNDLDWHRINDRQFGVLLIDANGVERYVRLGAIVAELREDITARELMEKEIDEYNNKQAKKAQRQADSREKAARDKAAREAKKKEKEAV